MDVQLEVAVDYT